jgi:hypothetical protein
MFGDRFERFRSSHWSGFSLIFLLALGLRFYAIGQESLWIDEIRTYWFASSTWERVWVEYPTLEVHPPLYFALLKLWMGVFGTTEAAMRSLACLFSLAAMTFVYLTARIVTGKQSNQPAWIAALVFAIATQQLQYAQEVRFYSALTMAFAMVVYATVWFLNNPNSARDPIWALRSRPAWAAYVCLALGAALLMWFHSLGALYNLSFALVMGIWWARVHRASLTVLINFSLVVAAALLIYSPNIANLFNTLFNMQTGGYWISAPSLERLAELFSFTYGFEQPYANKIDFALTALVVALAGVGGYGIWRSGRQQMALALIVFSFAPFLLSTLITYGLQPTLLDRTLVPMFAPWSVLIGASVLTKFRYRAGLAALVVVIVAYGAYAINYYKEVRKEPWRDVVGYVADNAAPDEPVFLLNNIIQIAFDYYLRDSDAELDLRPLPDRFPANRDTYIYPIGGRSEPRITDARAREAFDQVVGAQRIWMVARSSFRFEETQGFVEDYYATHSDCTMLVVRGNPGIVVYRYDNPSSIQKHEKPSCGFEGDQYEYLPF